jgi:beta-glucanase (GH16 family)
MPTERPTRFLKVAGVSLVGLAVLASCSPPPQEGSAAEDQAMSAYRWAPEHHHEDDERHERGRRDRHRQTQSTAAPTTAPPEAAAPPSIPSVVAPTTPAQPSPSGTPTPNGPTGTWNLRFSDEFDGSSLDTSKWRPNWFGSSDTSVTEPINGYEESCYDPSQVRVADGMLHLTAVRLSAARPGCTKKDGSPASYASGMVMSDQKYNFTYGYMEARINLPGANNRPENWAAFWANGQSWPRDGEIDVMETLGGEPRWHFHYADGGGHRSTGSRFDLITPKTGWHTFGALWEPGRITFYYDGREVGSTTSGVTSSPMYLILNHALSSHISGPIQAPSTLQVDYVRHWQR